MLCYAAYVAIDRSIHLTGDTLLISCSSYPNPHTRNRQAHAQMAAAEEPIVNTPFPDSWLPIHILAAKGDIPALDSDLGSNPALPRLVDARTLGGGLTPLALAAEKGHTEAMAWLLRRGADPRIANDDGLSPLALAARAGHTEALKLLLASPGHRGASSLLAQADRWGRLPLLIAAAHGNAAAFACLLDATLAGGQAEAVLEGLYSTGEGNGQTTLLIHACRFGHPALVRALLSRGADPCHAYGPLTPLGAAKAVGSGACEALLNEWERIYGMAKARAVDDAQQATAAAVVNTGVVMAAAAGPPRPLSPTLDVATQVREGLVAAEAVKGMADDTFAALLGMMGGKTTGEAVENTMNEVDEGGGQGNMEEGGGDGEEEPWDW